MKVNIRPECPEDIAGIDAIIISAFLDTAHSVHTEQFIVKALREAGVLAVSLVAESGGILIGHIAVSPVSIPGGSSGWFGLGPVSVAPWHQGHGVGTKLIITALDSLEESGAGGCVVLGDPSFYSRFGFRSDPGIQFPDVPQEYFQVIVFGGGLSKGIVSYHEAFNTKY